MLLFLLPALALAAPKIFSPEGTGARLSLRPGESAENRAGEMSSANDIVSTITLRKIEGGDAEITFSHTDHCLPARAGCEKGMISEAKNFTLHPGQAQLLWVLQTALTVTLTATKDGGAEFEIVRPTAEIRSKPWASNGEIAVRGTAAGVLAVRVSLLPRTRGKGTEKAVTVTVADGRWKATFSEVAAGNYNVSVMSGDGRVWLAQLRMTVK